MALRKMRTKFQDILLFFQLKLLIHGQLFKLCIVIKMLSLKGVIVITCIFKALTKRA